MLQKHSIILMRPPFFQTNYLMVTVIHKLLWFGTDNTILDNRLLFLKVGNWIQVWLYLYNVTWVKILHSERNHYMYIRGNLKFTRYSIPISVKFKIKLTMFLYSYSAIFFYNEHIFQRMERYMYGEEEVKDSWDLGMKWNVHNHSY